MERRLIKTTIYFVIARREVGGRRQVLIASYLSIPLGWWVNEEWWEKLPIASDPIDAMG